MKNILPLLLSGFLITLFTKIMTAKDCYETFEDIEYKLRCTNTTIQDMENTSNSRVETIEFQDSTIKTITPKSFLNYPKVITLSFQHTEIENITDKAFLLAIKRLRILAVQDLGDIKIPYFPDWILPTTVMDIMYANVNLKTISFTDKNIPHLTIFNLANNSLTSVPILNPAFPLHSLTLSGNPDIVVTVEDFFPFCHMQILHIDSLLNTGTRFTAKWTICHCLRLKKYIKQFSIRTDFSEALCGNATDENCSLNFDGAYKADHRNCIPPFFIKPNTSLNTGTSSSTPTNPPMLPEERDSTWFIKAFSILFLLSLLIVTIFTIFVYLWRNKGEKKNQSEAVEDTVLEEGEVEELPNEDRIVT